MTDASQTNMRPKVTGAPHRFDTQSSAPVLADSRAQSLIARAAQEVLATTFWFDPAPRSSPYPVTVRFSGRRADVEGPLAAGDHFVHEETVAEVVPGSGPVSVTARIGDINPGRWLVSAQLQGPGRSTRGRRGRRTAEPLAGPDASDASNISQYPLLPRLWRRWTPQADSSFETAEPVRTHLAPLVRVPGIVPLSWVTLVTLGMAVALALQHILAGLADRAVAPVWTTTLVAIVAGILGAKGWYIVKHWREHRFEGWCIQGFIVVASLTALLLFAIEQQPTGAILDITVPGLMFGLAIGRMGCFFAGCCGGPPTASRWGVWSSDQRVGARRVPTQLLESALALSLGLGALAMVVGHKPMGGALFAGALAAYTLGRQGILTLRAEARQTRLAVSVSAVVTASVLVIAVATMVFAMVSI
jgi:phosphatidylglycerol---prolipoprotein diacylglyceryl transferase